MNKLVLNKYGVSLISMVLMLGAQALYAEHAELHRNIKVRGSAFIPTSCLFREIYGTAGGSFDVEFTADIWDYLQAWANYDWFSKHGNSIGFCSPTKINISSISFGLKYPHEIRHWLTLYAGVGPSFALVKLHNCSFCGPQCCSKSSIGFVVKTGADFFFSDRGFVDIFVDYAYQQVAFEQRTSVSNVRIGGGLGVAF